MNSTTKRIENYMLDEDLQLPTKCLFAKTCVVVAGN